MKVIIFGASGMVGKGVLLECLADPSISEVLAVGRSTCEVRHEKLHEIIRSNFADYADLETELTGYDACFYCLGVSSAGMSESDYSRVTYDLTIRAAEVLVRLNPEMTFCYVSGAGTDETEQGRVMWARVKGKTENAVMRMAFKGSYMFRPGYIQPMKGIESKTRIYRLAYAVLRPVYPLLTLIAPNHVTTTEKVGLAMIRVARDGYAKNRVEAKDINVLAA